MNSKKSSLLALSMAFLVTGNLVGAGILALPINTGLCGFMPSIIAMLVIGVAMFFSAIILAREAVSEREETFNYPSLYHKYLGSVGKWVAMFANLIILYGLITAYLTGGTKIIASLLPVKVPGWAVLTIFFLIITSLNLTGLKFIRKYNILLMFLLWASFAIIVFMAEHEVKLERLEFTDWYFIPAAVPIIITAFHFHNIIPNVCHHLDWKLSTIWKAMLIGMILSLVMNVIWIQVGVGALPILGDNSLVEAFRMNLPATIPLSKHIGSSFFITCSLLFALLAITTSYLANGTGLLGFITDLTQNHFNHKNKITVVALSFIPPFLISLFYPNIFLKTLNIVGGIGIVTLFGILPSIIAIMKAKSKLMKSIAFFFLVLFSTIFVLEILQETGFLQIEPQIEHWRIKL